MATRRGTARAERLDGSAAADTLLGLAGNDKLFGLAGNDVLDGGLGADLMSGGRGNDSYRVDHAGDRVVEKRGEGTDTVRASVSHTLAAEVENLILLGSAALSATGNAGANQLTGNSARNLLTGGAGNDVLNGGGGIDTLRGGTGNDTYIVNVGAVRITEAAGAGIDLVKSSVSYTLPANVEKLIVTGNLFVHAIGNALDNIMIGSAASNVLDGKGGDDVLDGRAGNDTLKGGEGNDIFYVDADGDSVIEGVDEGHDTVRTALDGYVLPANVEDLELSGAQNLAATGNELANHISGNAGANHLAGGDGGDTLDGAAGADLMEGGPGNDVYFVDHAGDVIDEAAAVTLLRFNFQNVAGDTFANPGTALKVDAISDVGAWTTQDAGTLLPDGLKGFDLEPNRGLALGATGFDDGDPLSSADDGNALLFSFTVAAGQRIDITGFSFAEQSSNGARGNGPSLWQLHINGELVASGSATLGNPGGQHAGAIELDALLGLTGAVTVSVSASGTDAANGSWRIDDFILTGTVGGGGIDVVNSSVDITLSSGVEQLVLTGSAALRGTGNEFANDITGNGAANLLDGAGGADRVNGGAGDDVIVYDALDTLLDGGTGTDTLRVDGSGVTLDLTLVDDARLLDFDHLDITGSGANALILALSDVLAIGADHATLRISGDAGDSITSSGQGWMANGDGVQTIDGEQYQSYSAASVHLLVDLELSASLS
ncbi:MAG: hypothetical protein IPM80_09680 [Proteobacteria bacterium]|nr:hypothetical protein [Pseudomonadota bacterium]